MAGDFNPIYYLLIFAVMRRYLLEAIGTFALVLVGCGSMVLDEVTHGGVGPLGVSLAFGGIVFLVIAAIGNQTGAHINPAVSIAFWRAGRLSKRDLGYYIFFQLFGAFIASIILRIFFPESCELGNTYAHTGTLNTAFIEFGITFGLMFTIHLLSSVAQLKLILIALGVGLYVGLACYFFGPVTNASMNPARSIGPNLVNGNLSNLWLYIAMPILGAWLATPTCRLFWGNTCCYPTNSC